MATSNVFSSRPGGSLANPAGHGNQQPLTIELVQNQATLASWQAYKLSRATVNNVGRLAYLVEQLKRKNG